uniref:Uncharacterized protein n=1 Tax=Globodera pallida TaxID=36090 RepID=A0A183CL25_GLOPA
MAVTTTIMAAEGTTTGTAEGTKTLSRGRRPAASITCAVAEIGPDHQRRWERVIVSSTLGTVVSVLTVAVHQGFLLKSLTIQQ